MSDGQRAPRLAPTNPATGEPRRPATVWIAAACFALAVVFIGTSLAQVYWNAIGDFEHASLLMSSFQTDPGSLQRVLLAVAVTVAALVASIACVIAGFYGWAGFRWTRWGAIIAFVLSGLSIMLNPVAWAAIVFSVAGAVLVWLPPAGRFFAAWSVRRHPVAHYAPPVTEVRYGPLPRYR